MSQNPLVSLSTAGFDGLQVTLVEPGDENAPEPGHVSVKRGRAYVLSQDWDAMKKYFRRQVWDQTSWDNSK